MLQRHSRALDSLTRGQLALGLGALFVLSRLGYYWGLGVRFNDYPLRVYWQFLAPRLLRTRLLESLLYLHSQPPLFNLYLGAVLKLGGPRPAPLLHAVSLACGLGVLLVSFSLMRRLGVSRGLAAVLSLWLVTSPAFVAYENWLFYSLPMALLLAASALLLEGFLRRGGALRGLGFFFLLFLIGATRSVFHLAWFLLVLAGLLAVRRPPRCAVLRAAALPLLLLVALYAKNLALFGSFSSSSWLGMNLARLTVEELAPEERERLIASGRLSELSRVPAFGRPSQYPPELSEPDPRFAGVPAVSWLDKLTEAANYNHLGYARVSRLYLGDALWVLRHRPATYLRGVGKAWEIYFRSASSLKFLGVENRRRLATAFDVYDYVFFGRVPWVGFPRTELGEADFSGARYLALWVGLPLVLGFGVAAALGRVGALGREGRVVVGYLCFNIAWVALVGNLLELGENNRFRFETDPLSLVLLGLLLETWASTRSGKSPESAPNQASAS